MNNNEIDPKKKRKVKKVLVKRKVSTKRSKIGSVDELGEVTSQVSELSVETGSGAEETRSQPVSRRSSTINPADLPAPDRRASAVNPKDLQALARKPTE